RQSVAQDGSRGRGVRFDGRRGHQGHHSGGSNRRNWRWPSVRHPGRRQLPYPNWREGSLATVRRRGGSRAALPWRRGETADDEDLLARLDEAELAPGDLLDGGRILGQTTRGFAQERVFGALPRDRCGERVVLTLRPQQGEQTSIADQRVPYQQGDAEQEEDPEDLLRAGDRAARVPASMPRGRGKARHA